jgi:hypothetical protein
VPQRGAQTKGNCFFDVHETDRDADEHHDDKILIVVVDTRIVTLQLQHTGIEIDGLNGLKNDREVLGPSDSNPGGNCGSEYTALAE